MRQVILSAVLAASCIAWAGPPAQTVHDICDYGARPDGKTLCTESIQKAIDTCSGQGGGTVYLPPGTFLSGTLVMRSGVTLRLDTGCSPPAGTAVFLKVDGATTGGVTLTTNDFSGVQAVTQVGAEVPRGAIAEMANRTN